MKENRGDFRGFDFHKLNKRKNQGDLMYCFSCKLDLKILYLQVIHHISLNLLLSFLFGLSLKRKSQKFKSSCPFKHLHFPFLHKWRIFIALRILLAFTSMICPFNKMIYIIISYFWIAISFDKILIMISHYQLNVSTHIQIC